MLQTLPIMLVLCLMFSGTYYAKNYASILIIPLKPGMSLMFSPPISRSHACIFKFHAHAQSFMHNIAPLKWC